MQRYLFITIVLLLLQGTRLLHAQTKVSGTVTDALTNETIPFANIFFKGTNTGTVTDVNGNFTIQADNPSDSLVASFVGYISASIPVTKNKSQVINFSLKASKMELPEIVIRPGVNPALAMLKKIQENKEKNDKKNLDAYEQEVYTKLEFDINNITEKFKKKKVMRPFAFVFDNIDTTATNKKPFLPIFISEALSDFYYRSSPAAQKEIIKASKVSGVENETVTQFLGDMYQNTNIYDNFINVFGKSFVSPLANIGQVYYRYYIVDSAFFGDKWCYKITFRPRRKQELTFTGDFWVNDTSFAIRKISARIANDANVNFVEDLAVVQEYELVDNKQWMVTKDMLVVDFVAKEEGMSFIGRRSTSYKKIILNQPKPHSFFAEDGSDIIVAADAGKKDDAFWAHARHDSLSLREKKIYSMVDTLQTLPAFKTWVDLVILFTTGYKEIGNFELGPYYTLYSFNTIEGNRFRLGGRTGNNFSTNVILDGYGAYGTKDGKFKYKGGIQYYLSKKPRQSVGFSYKNDVEQLGKSENAFQQDNILASVLRRIPSNKLTTIEETKFYYEREWVPGFSSRIGFTHRFYSPLDPLDYSYYVNDTKTGIRNTLNTSEISLYTRFAYKEKFVTGKVDRISLGTKYPVLQVNYLAGLKGVMGSNFSYNRLTLKVDDKFFINPLGWAYILAEAGKTWGTVPYPLLEVHRGNETYSYDYMAFNMMNYYEFVSDTYLSLFLAHHFDGLFLNKIPLLRKLKWREVLTAKGVAGNLSEKNRQILLDPNAFFPLRKPYAEAGAGIENIFEIFRVDVLWRLSYLDHPGVSKVGIRGSIQVSF